MEAKASKIPSNPRRTIKNRVAAALVYALLEWTLIVLLLLQGLFSNLVSSFASYFALHPPCILCSRLDRLFRRGRRAYLDHLCHSHKAEISRLRYCAAHRRLADPSATCAGCSPPAPPPAPEGAAPRCSCCDAELESEFSDVDVASRRDLRGTHLGVSGVEEKGTGKIEAWEEVEEDSIKEHAKKEEESPPADGLKGIATAERQYDGIKVFQEDKESTEPVKIPGNEEESMLVFVNSLDSNSSNFTSEIASLGVSGIDGQEIQNFEYGSKFDQDNHGSSVENGVVDCQHAEKLQLELEKPENGSSGGGEQCTITLSKESGDERRDGEEALGETRCEASSMTKVCAKQETEYLDEARHRTWMRLRNLSVDVSTGESKDENGEIKTELLEKMSCHVSECHGTEIESEAALATPISVDAVDNLHKSLLFDRREVGTESIDGSAVSEMEGQEGILTLEQLKSALSAERRALAALHAELEEERNASAIAANHTMAMITRLQEEKAAMQMEALQYQRMMEEQSEYDQEAVQILNELMLKRDRENQELEKELEVYRKKVLFYEEKERQRTRRSRAVERSVSSSESSSVDDSDELSASFDSSEDSFRGHPNGNVSAMGLEKEPAEHLSVLGESVAEFEKERLSILDQLKELEEKLFSMGDDNSFSKEDAHCEHLRGEYGNLDYSPSNEVDGVSNHITHARQNISLEGKNLLPLFDAATSDEEEGHFREEEFESDLPVRQTKMPLEEELQSIYERLHALEADREFLKHCLGSSRKGEKGLDLLQEILQHLRDLRRIELRDRKACDVMS